MRSSLLLRDKMQTLHSCQHVRPFKQRKTFATRVEEVAGIREKFPTKVPVIVERYQKEKYLPLLDKTKFLVPQELTMTQFITIISGPDLEPLCKDGLTKSAVYQKVAFDPKQMNRPLGLMHSLFTTSSRSRMALSATQAFYLLVNNKSLASMSLTLAEIYRDYKDEDGFVYMTYASQEMFGCLLTTGKGKPKECLLKT